MEIPLQITSRNFELTGAIEAKIRDEAVKLEKIYERITRCRVVVESPHRHHQQGNLFNVQIYMTLPRSELVIKRESNKDLYVAIRDSFNAARRKLEGFSRRQRGDVKHHEEVPQGSISALFPEMGYGLLTTTENLEVYFHENSVVNTDFKKLKIGMKVRFSEEKGDKGPQASSVTIKSPF